MEILSSGIDLVCGVLKPSFSSRRDRSLAKSAGGGLLRLSEQSTPALHQETFKSKAQFELNLYSAEETRS